MLIIMATDKTVNNAIFNEICAYLNSLLFVEVIHWVKYVNEKQVNNNKNIISDEKINESNMLYRGKE